MTCYRRSSTTIDPACSPPNSATTKGKSTNATATRTSPPPMRSSNPFPMPRTFLKPGVTFQHLDAIAYAQSDLDAAPRSQCRPRRTVPNHRLPVGTRRRVTPPLAHSKAFPTTPSRLQWPTPPIARRAPRAIASTLASTVHPLTCLPILLDAPSRSTFNPSDPNPIHLLSTPCVQAHLRIGKGIIYESAERA